MISFDVKTEPAISAENFGVMETSSYSEEEPSEMKDIETPQESDSSPTGDTLNSPEEIHNPETPDDSNPELNIDEKIQIANFCRDNPAIPGILVCENFSTKFKKCISAPTLHQIISTGVYLAFYYGKLTIRQFDIINSLPNKNIRSSFKISERE